MKDYLKAKLILFSQLLPKKSFVITDKLNKEYKNLKQISKKRKLKLLDIDKTLNKIQNFPLSLIDI